MLHFVSSISDAIQVTPWNEANRENYGSNWANGSPHINDNGLSSSYGTVCEYDIAPYQYMQHTQVGSEVFLRGTYIEAGFHSLGSFGTAYVVLVSSLLAFFLLFPHCSRVTIMLWIAGMSRPCFSTAHSRVRSCRVCLCFPCPFYYGCCCRYCGVQLRTGGRGSGASFPLPSSEFIVIDSLVFVFVCQHDGRLWSRRLPDGNSHLCRHPAVLRRLYVYDVAPTTSCALTPPPLQMLCPPLLHLWKAFRSPSRNPAQRPRTSTRALRCKRTLP